MCCITLYTQDSIEQSLTVCVCVCVCVCVLGVSALPGTCRTKSGDLSGTRGSRRAVPGGDPEQGHLCPHPQGNPHTWTPVTHTWTHQHLQGPPSTRQPVRGVEPMLQVPDAAFKGCYSTVIRQRGQRYPSAVGVSLCVNTCSG